MPQRETKSKDPTYAEDKAGILRLLSEAKADGSVVEINVRKARVAFKNVVDHVFDHSSSVVIERHGDPVSALVPLADFQLINALKKAASPEEALAVLAESSSLGLPQRLAAQFQRAILKLSTVNYTSLSFLPRFTTLVCDDSDHPYYGKISEIKFGGGDVFERGRISVEVEDGGLVLEGDIKLKEGQGRLEIILPTGQEIVLAPDQSGRAVFSETLNNEVDLHSLQFKKK